MIPQIFKWLPANKKGQAAGYVEGCHYTYEGRSIDAVVWQHGAVTVVGVCGCSSKEGAEQVMARELANPAPLERDRTIKFKELFS
jgi:hypothetical protein